MKTLSANFLCCNCKLYKVGLFIGFIYLIPNLIIIACAFGGGYDVYTVPLLCALTVLTSLLLIKGLMEENHRLLLPWLANIGVLILFNSLLFMLQFGELNRRETKESFYLQLGFFISLELQILFWYIIYCLLKRGYEKSKLLTGPLKSISKLVENPKTDFYKVNLLAADHFMGEKKVVCV